MDLFACLERDAADSSICPGGRFVLPRCGQRWSVDQPPAAWIDRELRAEPGRPPRGSPSSTTPEPSRPNSWVKFDVATVLDSPSANSGPGRKRSGSRATGSGSKSPARPPPGSVPLAILGYAIPAIGVSLNGKVVAVDLWNAPAWIQDSAVPDRAVAHPTCRPPRRGGRPVFRVDKSLDDHGFGLGNVELVGEWVLWQRAVTHRGVDYTR